MNDNDEKLKEEILNELKELSLDEIEKILE